MKIVFRILLASFLFATAATNGEILLSTLNNRQNSPPVYTFIGNYFGEDLSVGIIVQTGNNPDGYILNSVTITMADAWGWPNNFGVYFADLHGNPLDSTSLIGNEFPRRAGRYTYRPQSRYFLKPNTEYYLGTVSVLNAWNNYYLLPGTTVDERVRSSDGWRINDTTTFRNLPGGGSEIIGTGGVLLIAIDATRISLPPPPPALSGNATLRSLALSGVPLNFASNITPTTPPPSAIPLAPPR